MLAWVLGGSRWLEGLSLGGGVTALLYKPLRRQVAGTTSRGIKKEGVVGGIILNEGNGEEWRWGSEGVAAIPNATQPIIITCPCIASSITHNINVHITLQGEELTWGSEGRGQQEEVRVMGEGRRDEYKEAPIIIDISFLTGGRWLVVR